MAGISYKQLDIINLKWKAWLTLEAFLRQWLTVGTEINVIQYLFYFNGLASFASFSYTFILAYLNKTQQSFSHGSPCSACDGVHECVLAPYVDHPRCVALFEVVEHGGFLQVRHHRHVLDLIKLGRIHGKHLFFLHCWSLGNRNAVLFKWNALFCIGPLMKMMWQLYHILTFISIFAAFMSHFVCIYHQ